MFGQQLIRPSVSDKKLLATDFTDLPAATRSLNDATRGPGVCRAS
jgi:hypothetical protein